MSDANKGIWFVYDGECPLCHSAAHALRIKKDYGNLHLVNAREACADDPLIQKINAHGLDLDEGMVIYADDRFYHGQDALRFMAKYSDAKNAFSMFCKSLFWSRSLSALTYPWMRGVRNWLLRRKRVGRMDNLEFKEEPIFKSIFGKDWDELPPVMQKHYANRPYTDDVHVVRGALDVMSKAPIKWLGPIMKLMGQIPARNEDDVPVTVSFESDQNSKSFHFVRTFNFKNSAPYVFHSRMMQIKGNEVVELMRFGLGWKMRYRWDGEKVVLEHSGYILNLFGHFIPVPLSVFMGKGYAEEIAVDENNFDMITNITHPLWGRGYQYKGRFEVVEK